MIRCPQCGTEIREWWTLTATLPSDVRELYDDAVESLRSEGLSLHANRRVAAGQVVEALLASYFAGPGIQIRTGGADGG